MAKPSSREIENLKIKLLVIVTSYKSLVIRLYGYKVITVLCT